MRRFLCLTLFFLMIALAGCGTVGNDRTGFSTKPFTAEIEGTRGELAFSAELTVSAGERTIRYTAPESLAGLTATASDDGIRVVQGSLSKQTPAGSSGLFLPLDLLTTAAEPTTVQERAGEKVLTYADGTEILLNADGTPRAVIRSDIMFTVTDFQTNS